MPSPIAQIAPAMPASSTVPAAPVDVATLAEALRAPMPVEAVEWRPQGKTNPGARVQVVAYLDARTVADRLDSACGPLGWAFDWQPISTNDRGEVMAAKGTITIAGVAKSDVGTASNFEPSKGAVSDALKRAAVLWGIGRELYELPPAWVTLDDKGHIGERTIGELRAALARRFHAATAGIGSTASVSTAHNARRSA